jgi:hypothetical protein
MFLSQVAYVGYVFYVDNPDALVHQGSPDPVSHQIGAEVANVGVAINRWPAGVHTGHTGFQGFNLFDSFVKGVVDPQQRCPPTVTLRFYHFIMWLPMHPFTLDASGTAVDTRR